MRSVNKVKGIRIVVGAVIESIKPLFNVLLFTIFIITLLATFGLHLFSGMYEFRCRITEEPINENSWPVTDDELF